MTFVAPKFKLEAFHCPYCGTYAHMHWSQLIYGNRYTHYYQAACQFCKEVNLWKATQYEASIAVDGILLDPDNSCAPTPEIDMPEDVLIDYNEAALIFNKSPRGASALLRLALQKLCKHLGEEGENINIDIRNLASKNVIPPLVIKVADTVRITGNNAVHPGEMNDEDFDKISIKMFDLLNFIVKKSITEPKELEALYQLTPEGPRKAAESKDAKAQGK